MRQGQDGQAASRLRERLEIWLPFVVTSWATGIVVLGVVFKILDLNLAELFEGWTLTPGVRWMNAAPDLTWLRGFPITTTAYGPEFHVLVKTLGTWFPDLHPLLAGRLISAAAGVGALALIAVAVFRERRTIADTWLGAIVFLTAPLVTQFWWQARVDSLAVFWTLAAYAAATTRHGPLLSAACLVLGSLAKQTVAFHALPLGLWFLTTTSPPFKRFFLFIGLGACLAVAAWVPVLTVFHGYFWESSVLFHAAKSTRLWYAFTLLYSYLPSAFMLAAIAAAVHAAVKRPLLRVLSDRWWLGFTFSLVLDTVLLVKDGSWAHYALTEVAFGAVLIGCYARDMVGISMRLAPLALAAVSFVAAFPMFMGLRALDWRPAPPTRPAFVRASLEAAGRPEFVLADGNTAPYVLHEGIVPMVSDSFALKILAETNQIDLTPLLRALRSGQIQYVLLDRSIEDHQSLVGTWRQLWPGPVLNELATHYEEIGGVPGLHLFRPKSASESRHP